MCNFLSTVERSPSSDYSYMVFIFSVGGTVQLETERRVMCEYTAFLSYEEKKKFQVFLIGKQKDPSHRHII